MTKGETSSSHLRLRNQALSLQKPAVMGILNTTPDSFSDGGKFESKERALQRIGEMIDEGATIIDIGGESTRPGSDPVSEKTEMERVLPVLERALSDFEGTIFSVDTTKFRVAEEALKLGAHIINDISGLKKEPRLKDLCYQYKAGYVLMHSQGDPQTMQKNPVYKNVIDEISCFFDERLTTLHDAGVEAVIIDPGIGFGKTLEHNLKIVDGLQSFKRFNVPVLVGASRKSMIGNILGEKPADERLAGTIAVHYHCLMNGANILRVHDVSEAVDSIKIFEALNKA